MQDLLTAIFENMSGQMNILSAIAKLFASLIHFLTKHF